MLKVSFDKMKVGDSVREFVSIARTDSSDVVHRRATDEDKTRYRKEYVKFQEEYDVADKDVPDSGVKQLKPEDLPTNPTVIETLTRLGRQQEGVAAGQAAKKTDNAQPLASEVANEQPGALAKLDAQKDGEPPKDFMAGFVDGQPAQGDKSQEQQEEERRSAKHHKKHH